MKANVKPGFFIVGAPKSGTTSMYHYLQQHPQVYLPRIKELNFFCTDLHFRFPLLNEQQFLAYYTDYKDEKAVGEVSVWNLYSKAAAQNIYHFNPEAKIIILLRNPADMMYALHSNHVFNDNEIIPGFEDALDAQEDRKQGLRISASIKCPVEGLYYFEVGAYAEQVRRYVQLFGQQQVKVILFDDLVADTKSAYASLLQFIEVVEIIPDSFKQYNMNKTTRSNLLKQLTVHTPTTLKNFGKWLFPHQSVRRDRLMYWLWKINTRESKRPALKPEVRRRITDRMKEDIASLEQLLRRDLSHWRA